MIADKVELYLYLTILRSAMHFMKRVFHVTRVFRYRSYNRTNVELIIESKEQISIASVVLVFALLLKL